MIIIVEGPDGAGKTTLAKRLVAAYGIEYRHEGPPPRGLKGPDGALRYYGALLDRARGEHVVFDRGYRGETIYGPALRGASQLDAYQVRMLDRLARAVGTTHVLCLPPFETCYTSWASGREELFHDESTLRVVYDRYAGSLDTYDVVYDHTRDRFDIFAGRAYHTFLPVGLTGSPRARYLLVSDRRSDVSNPVNVPFFGSTGSGPYLTRVLDVAGFDERELAFVNAHDDRGVPAKLDDLWGFTVIALGKNAAKTCARQGLRVHLEVPHPQYWKRFHHHDVEAYAALLRRARDL